MKKFARYNSDIFVTVTHLGVTFSTSAVKTMNCSNVNVYFNVGKKQMAIKADANGDWNFASGERKKYVRWNVKHIINKIKTFVDTEGKRFIGQYDCDENAIIFDFNVSTPTRKR